MLDGAPSYPPLPLDDEDDVPGWFKVAITLCALAVGAIWLWG